MNDSETPATQAPKAAQAAYERALTAHWDAEGRYELAVLRSDPEGRERARQALHAATARLAEARAAVVATQATAAPSFEDLLRNPYLQFDRDGAVLASIRQYHRAPTAAGRTRLEPSPAAVEPGWTGLPNLAGFAGLAFGPIVASSDPVAGAVTVGGNEPLAGQEMWSADEATTPGRQLVPR